MSNLYYSTRNKEEKVNFAEGVTRGIASDGGLFVPETFENIDIYNKQYLEMTYQEMAVDILSKFLVDFNLDEIKDCVYKAYGDNFDSKEIVPIKSFENFAFLELFKGPTLAFKDMALSILPKFMKLSKEKNNIKEDIVILTATSGDTGKAALEGFANQEGIKIIVFFPTDGVSDVQKAQMQTQIGANTHVIAIHGNFDDAQNGVKELLNDKEFKEILKANSYVFSSANSINIGRLLPQIVYYVYGYFNLVKTNKIKIGDKINIVVPTGNFGNILASYYASIMGIPVNKFICASNSNNVLTDFINTGTYDINRGFETTISPSMDILISSNLERFLEALSNKDVQLIKNLMVSLKTTGKYELTQELKKKMNNFYASFASDSDTKAIVKEIYDKYSYVIDTHTAVAYKVYDDYVKATGDKDTQTLIAATASPFKFTRSVVEAITEENQDSKTDFELIEVLSNIAKLDIPKGVFQLDKKETIHKTVVEVNEMKNSIKDFLKL